MLAGARTFRLAREDELAILYPQYEVGAMPPFGAVFGHRVFVERCLVGEPEMVFNAGTHTDAIRMHYGDFAELAKPTVGQFCRCRGEKRRGWISAQIFCFGVRSYLRLSTSVRICFVASSICASRISLLM
jgi:hypothetical protein